MTTTKAKAKMRGPIGMVHPLLGSVKRVPFGTINVSVERFQVRRPEAASFVQGIIKRQEASNLVTELVRLTESGTALDPVILWEDANGAPWVVDGHHRMTAWAEAGAKPKTMVYAQYLKGATEAEAREFALGIGLRLRLNMHPSEGRDEYWRMLLCGETIGSVRGRVERYGVSQSTVQRMDAKRGPVLTQLQQMAQDEGAVLDVSFIRANAPPWKEQAEWRDGKVKRGNDGPDRRVIEGMLKTFTLRFANHAKAQPDVLIEAFKEFLEDVTGRELQVRFTDDAWTDGTAYPTENSDF